MRAILVLFVIAAGSIDAQVFDEETEGYIQDAETFKELFNCVMDMGPCFERHQTYRDVIPGYTKTLCSDCHPDERALYHKYDAMIADLYPNQHKQVRDKFMDVPTYEVIRPPFTD